MQCRRPALATLTPRACLCPPACGSAPCLFPPLPPLSQRLIAFASQFSVSRSFLLRFRNQYPPPFPPPLPPTHIHFPHLPFPFPLPLPLPAPTPLVQITSATPLRLLDFISPPSLADNTYFCNSAPFAPLQHPHSLYLICNRICTRTRPRRNHVLTTSLPRRAPPRHRTRISIPHRSPSKAAALELLCTQERPSPPATRQHKLVLPVHVLPGQLPKRRNCTGHH